MDRPEQTADELKAENSHLRDVIDDQRQTIVMLARMLSEAQRPASVIPPWRNVPSHTVPTVTGEAV